MEENEYKAALYHVKANEKRLYYVIYAFSALFVINFLALGFLYLKTKSNNDLKKPYEIRKDEAGNDVVYFNRVIADNAVFGNTFIKYAAITDTLESKNDTILGDFTLRIRKGAAVFYGKGNEKTITIDTESPSINLYDAQSKKRLTLGSTDLSFIKTGGTESTSPGSVISFDMNGHVVERFGK